MQDLSIISRARDHGDRVAFRAAGQSHTYSDLLRRSAEIASVLLQDEADLKEARIGFLIPAGFDYSSVQWGIWRAGGIAVPLSLSATKSELGYALSDADVSTVVVLKAYEDRVLQLCESRRLRLLNTDDLSGDRQAELPEIEADRRAMILYTSGTTNKPKGVVSTHANIEAQIKTLVDAWQWSADDSIPLFLPLHHIHGIINVMSCALWSGAMIEPFEKFTMDAVLHRVSSGAYSVFMAVPTIYVKLISTLQSMSADESRSIIEAFSKMRLMISGSAALPASVHNTWTSLTGQKLLERYGMTEIGMGLSNPYDGERRAGMAGRPLPNVQIRFEVRERRHCCGWKMNRARFRSEGLRSSSNTGANQM